MSIYRTNDLVVVVADSHAQLLLDTLIRRGKERRCLSDFSYAIDLQPKHDAFFRFTEQFLPHNLPSSLHLLLCWDHQDCGRSDKSLEANEAEALACLARHGVTAERALCQAFDPELEIVYAPVFARVKELCAKKDTRPPTDAEILRTAQRSRKQVKVPDDLSFEAALARYPKEMLMAMAVLINQRTSLGEIYGKLHGKDPGTLSITRMKAAAGPIARITAALQGWFPGEVAFCSEDT